MNKQKKILLALSLITLVLSLPLSKPKAENSNLLAELPRTGGMPQVTAQRQLDITELPRTGISEIAWGISALIPFGIYGLRRKKQIIEKHSASTIWILKQLKQE